MLYLIRSLGRLCRLRRGKPSTLRTPKELAKVTVEEQQPVGWEETSVLRHQRNQKLEVSRRRDGDCEMLLRGQV